MNIRYTIAVVLGFYATQATAAQQATAFKPIEPGRSSSNMSATPSPAPQGSPAPSANTPAGNTRGAKRKADVLAEQEETAETLSHAVGEIDDLARDNKRLKLSIITTQALLSQQQQITALNQIHILSLLNEKSTLLRRLNEASVENDKTKHFAEIIIDLERDKKVIEEQLEREKQKRQQTKQALVDATLTFSSQVQANIAEITRLQERIQELEQTESQNPVITDLKKQVEELTQEKERLEAQIVTLEGSRAERLTELHASMYT